MTEKNDYLDAPQAQFGLRYAESDFQFSEMAFSERKPEAGTILRRLGKTPTLDYRLVRLTYPGTTSYDDDELLDLKGTATVDILICKADRLLACAINEVAYDLPVERVQGKNLRHIACVPDDHTLFHCCPNKAIGRPRNLLFFLGKEVLSTRHRFQRCHTSATILSPLPEGMVMHSGRFVFSQVMDHLPMKTFRSCVQRYEGNRHVQSFTCLDQLLCMAFAQLTFRESLRDIEACLRAHEDKLYLVFDSISGGAETQI